jgi:hypothetical protein
MNCRNGWLREFLNDNFKKTFLNKTLKDHHKNYLFDIEKSLLPAAMIAAENIKKVNDINKLILVQKNIISEALHKIDSLRHKIHRINHPHNQVNATANNETTDRGVINFIRNCPQDDCRGFLSTQWKCGLCSIWVCPHCNKIKTEKNDTAHVCNKDDVETQTVLSLNTKSCPSCSVPIFKIDGCNQMWCTNCHVAFNWNTKKIETNVHNPHYFEWMRRNNRDTLNRNPLDFRCGRELDNVFTTNFSDLMKRLNTLAENQFKNKTPIPIENGDQFITNITDFKGYYNNIYNSIRNIIHVLIVDIPTFNVNREITNEDLRIRFLLNGITEKQFKNTICSRETKHEKNREIHDILVMFVHSATDIIYRIYDDGYSFINNNGIQLNFLIGKELTELINYVNENLLNIHKIYNSTTLMKYRDNCKMEITSIIKKKV